MKEDVLQEFWSVKKILGSLNKPDAKPVPSGKLVSMCRTLATDILKSQKIEFSKHGDKKSASGYLSRYKFKLGSSKYIAKCFVSYDVGQFSMVIWSEDEQDLLKVIIIGYILRDKSSMLAVGKEMMKKFVEDNNGTARAE